MEDGLIVIDTDVIIDFFRDNSPAADVFAELISSDKAAMTAISVFELYAGIEGAKRLRQIEALVQKVTVFPLNIIEAAIGGKIYSQLKSRGKLIGTHDILIAAICIANDLPLYSKNISHFSEIKDIRLLSPTEILSSRET